MKDDLTIEDVKGLLEEYRRFEKSCAELMAVQIKKKDITLSPEQSRLLFMIDSGKMNNQKVVAKKMHITPATLSVRLQRLEKAGYVRRKIDPNDKRNYILEVEPKGKELVKDSIEIMEEAAMQLFTGFTRDEFLMLQGYLERMKNNVRKLKEDKLC